uniref:Uncharacterized protein n=1 Tax=Biomphalaria glabrata TaxID=6526 RepID=A0A2C9L3P5_BIOGL
MLQWIKIKGELWIEEKETSTFLEVKDYLREKTSEILQKCIFVTKNKIDSSAALKRQELKKLENVVEDQQSTMDQMDEKRKATMDQMDEKRKAMFSTSESENTNQWNDLQKAIHERFDKLKEDINARQQAASICMSQLQTRCDSLLKEQNNEKERSKNQEMKIEQMWQIQKDFNSRLEEILKTQELLGKLADTTIGKLADLDLTSKRDHNYAFEGTSFSEEFHCQATGQSDVQCNKYCLHIIGQHEQQISDAGETDHRKYLKECSRNPGHTKFTPVNAFGLYHLPEGHRDKDLYDLIKAAADLTVKVSVTMTSPHRPEFWPNTETPYVLYNMRGTKQLRTGTGYVNFVEKLTNESCPCDGLNQVWWKITMWTATNLIFDDIEAKKTTLRFFYDHKHSPEIELKVFPIYSSHDVARDICWIQFDTCDRFIAERLQRAITLYNACKKVNNKYAPSSEMNKLIFIVSHPHGCYKQVSIGHWNDRFKMGCGFKLTHTAGTCQGSAGARVHCVGNDDLWVYSGRSKSGLQYSCS